MVFEPWGRREFEKFLYDKAQTELDSMVRFKLQPGIFLNDFLGFTLYAEEISADRTGLANVLLTPNQATGNGEALTMWAPIGSITGTVAAGDLTLTLKNGTAFSPDHEQDALSTMTFAKAEVDLLRIFRDRILGGEYKDDDFRGYPPRKLYQHIKHLKNTPDRSEGQYYRARHLFHKRIAAPFTTVVFALLGIVLGLQDPRHGKNRGFIGGGLVIVFSYVIIQGFTWMADKGNIDGVLAAWLPNLVLSLLAAFWLYQRNRLPLSEGAFDPSYFPGRAFKIPTAAEGEVAN